MAAPLEFTDFDSAALRDAARSIDGGKHEDVFISLPDLFRTWRALTSDLLELSKIREASKDVSKLERNIAKMPKCARQIQLIMETARTLREKAGTTPFHFEMMKGHVCIPPRIQERMMTNFMDNTHYKGCDTCHVISNLHETDTTFFDLREAVRYLLQTLKTGSAKDLGSAYARLEDAAKSCYEKINILHPSMAPIFERARTVDEAVVSGGGGGSAEFRDDDSIYLDIERKNPFRFSEEGYIESSRTALPASDPLKPLQLHKLKAFLDYFLLQPPTFRGIGYKGDGSVNLACLYGKTTKQEAELLKTQKMMECTSDEFSLLRKVMQNPAVLAKQFGLDPTKKDNLYAAKIYLKSICKLPVWKNKPGLSDEHYSKYRETLFNLRSGSIREKHLLLMENDPVSQYGAKTGSSLDIIVQNTFFSLPLETALDRHTCGTTLFKVFTDLYANDHLKHVFDALAIIMEKNKGGIYFASSVVGAGTLLAEKHSPPLSLGEYNQKHSIYCGCPIDDDGRVSFKMISTVIHEALHFIFKEIYQNASDPIKVGDEATAVILDEVLRKDREHRGSMTDPTLTHSSTWHTLTTELEANPSYFKGSFSKEMAYHRKLMRVEAIVRLMEQISAGESETTIQAIAPNLWAYYQKVTRPQIEQFCRESSHDFRPG